jgi:hypothetical protein
LASAIGSELHHPGNELPQVSLPAMSDRFWASYFVWRPEMQIRIAAIMGKSIRIYALASSPAFIACDEF